MSNKYGCYVKMIRVCLSKLHGLCWLKVHVMQYNVCLLHIFELKQTLQNFGRTLLMNACNNAAEKPKSTEPKY